MAYRFQKWQVYKDARVLRIEVNKLSKLFRKDEIYILTNQLRRAVLSVALQIAEGSNRKTEKDKNLFINRSITSLDEVVACFDCAMDDKYINQEEYNFILVKIETVSKQLRGLEKYIGSSY